jgi:hypothetical protein
MIGLVGRPQGCDVDSSLGDLEYGTNLQLQPLNGHRWRTANSTGQTLPVVAVDDASDITVALGRGGQHRGRCCDG